MNETFWSYYVDYFVGKCLFSVKKGQALYTLYSILLYTWSVRVHRKGAYKGIQLNSSFEY